MPPLGALEAALEREWRRYHVRAQITRFLSGFVLTLLATLSSGTYSWTVSAIAPVVVATAWTVAREMWPTLPWATVQKQLRAVEPTKPPGSAP